MYEMLGKTKSIGLDVGVSGHQNCASSQPQARKVGVSRSLGYLELWSYLSQHGKGGEGRDRRT